MEHQINAANAWAKMHASVFDLEKFKLIYFINPQKASTIKHQNKQLILEGGLIKHI
jgi:hypothetical protein